MSDFAVICEFNPFHNGHSRLFSLAREQGADRIVCVMSGNTVQRGEFAIADKYIRAEAALRSGADLVLELPFPWCSGSAESFAIGGVEIARHFADMLVFGSECGNIDILKKAAEIASDDSFRSKYFSALSDGKQAAQAYFEALNKRGISSLSSNDILGMEYIRAVRMLNATIGFATVERKGVAYNSTDVLENEYPSATAIRARWYDGKYENSERWLPKESQEVFMRAVCEGNILDINQLENILLSFFRLHDGDDFDGIVGAEGGLAHRFCAIAREECTLDGFLSKIKTKRYTDSHLRRTILYCLAGVTSNDLNSKPLYTTLLAANENGRALLSEKRKNIEFSVVTKPADAPTDVPQYRLTQKIDSIYSLLLSKKRAASYMLTKSPYIL